MMNSSASERFARTSGTAGGIRRTHDSGAESQATVISLTALILHASDRDIERCGGHFGRKTQYFAWIVAGNDNQPTASTFYNSVGLMQMKIIFNNGSRVLFARANVRTQRLLLGTHLGEPASIQDRLTLAASWVADR